jgi:hypothetical protein
MLLVVVAPSPANQALDTRGRGNSDRRSCAPDIEVCWRGSQSRDVWQLGIREDNTPVTLKPRSSRMNRTSFLAVRRPPLRLTGTASCSSTKPRLRVGLSIRERYELQNANTGPSSVAKYWSAYAKSSLATKSVDALHSNCD